MTFVFSILATTLAVVLAIAAKDRHDKERLNGRAHGMWMLVSTIPWWLVSMALHDPGLAAGAAGFTVVGLCMRSFGAQEPEKAKELARYAARGWLALWALTSLLLSCVGTWYVYDTLSHIGPWF